MAKKTDHYIEAPKVFADSQALSGRPVQIFHSDGEGVFSSKETQDILLKDKIRHEFSASLRLKYKPFRPEGQFLRGCVLPYYALVLLLVSGGKLKTTKFSLSMYCLQCLMKKTLGNLFLDKICC